MIVVVVLFDPCRPWDGGHMSIVMANLSASITWKVTVFIGHCAYCQCWYQAAVSGLL